MAKKRVTLQYSSKTGSYTRLAVFPNDSKHPLAIGFSYKKTSYGYVLMFKNTIYNDFPEEDRTLLRSKCDFVILDTPTDPDLWEDWTF